MTKKRRDLSFSLQFSFFTRFSLLERFLKSKLFFYFEPNSDTFDGNLGSRNTTKDTISLREACARAHTCAWLALPSARPNRHRHRDRERDRKRRRSPKKCRHATIIAVELIRPSKKNQSWVGFSTEQSGCNVFLVARPPLCCPTFFLLAQSA